jgi:hypothetical protein
MKNVTRDLTLAAGKLDSQTIRLIVLVGTLVLFVLAAGAPSAGGGSV